jgi:preprotein translocase SecE subunit
MAVSKPKSSTTPARVGSLGRIQKWLGEVYTELKRVTKPTPEETNRMTLAVLGVVVMFALWLGLLDIIFTNLTLAIDKWLGR